MQEDYQRAESAITQMIQIYIENYGETYDGVLQHLIELASFQKKREKDECWYCNKSILTVFLWKPRLGELSKVKSQATREHYEKWVKTNEAQLEPDQKPDYADGFPYIQGTFTDWRPKKMQNLIEFLKENDPIRPDFIRMAYD